MYARGGLSSYPGEMCWDPSRPSWLPYWLDTLTEETCNWGDKSAREHLSLLQGQYSGSIQNPLPPPALSVPAGGYDQAPGPTVNQPNPVDDIISKSWSDWLGQNQRFFEEQDTRDQIDESGKPKPTDWTPVVLLVGAVALLSFLKG